MPCCAAACRLLGLGFAVPGAYFLARGYINGALGRRLGLLFMMGGAQGLVGWWMVRSGLKVSVGGSVGGSVGDTMTLLGVRIWGWWWGWGRAALGVHLACVQRVAGAWFVSF
jgi:heme A synthase